MKKYLTTSLIALATFGFTVVPTFAETLSVTPILDFKTNLSIGTKNDDVKRLQVLLNLDTATQVATGSRPGAKGYETSTYGPATALAVKAFQRANGISPTGFVGPLTRAALNDYLIATRVGVPTIASITADTSVPGSASLNAKFYGGGEKPTVWFAYGVTPASMTVLSPETVMDKTFGTASAMITGLTGGDCFAQVFVKNSVGTAKSEWVHCSK